MYNSVLVQIIQEHEVKLFNSILLHKMYAYNNYPLNLEINTCLS